MTPAPALTPIPSELLQEIEELWKVCCKRYKFNSFWDNVLNVLGIVVSLAIVYAGIRNEGTATALLGAVVTALVTAQRAFPFNQRWQFYRILSSQAQNLLTETKNGTVTLEQAIATLKALRLDFAQQIPRGSSALPENGPAGGKPPKQEEKKL